MQLVLKMVREPEEFHKCGGNVDTVVILNTIESRALKCVMHPAILDICWTIAYLSIQYK